MLGQNTLWMELNAKHGTIFVPHSHDLSVFCKGIRDQRVWQIAWLNRQRVVADDIVSFRQSLEEGTVFVTNLIDLTMPNLLRRNDIASFSSPNALVAKANAEDWQVGGSGLNEFHANACLIGRARTGGEDNPVWFQRQRFGDAHLVIANDLRCGTDLFEIMDQVPSCGLESSTTPPPAWMWSWPSFNTAVRSAIHVSKSPFHPK